MIFDGLDEVIDPKKRDDIAEEITGFARTYPATRVIITSRIAGFDHRPFVQRTSAFVVATLDDLDAGQIETFSKTWFALTVRGDPEQAEARHEHLIRSVRDRPQLRTLAGNPLLLTVIALIARRQELPVARAGLYEHAVQIFCHQWDLEDKQLELPRDSPLKYLNLDDKLTILRRIAWSMLEGEGIRANIIEKDDLEEVIRSYFVGEWWPSDKAMCRRGAGEMIRLLEQRNYLICYQGAGLFGFIHRTFLEYLCAAQILWRIEKDRDLSVGEMCGLYIVPHCEDDSWREVILLLAAQLQPRDAVMLVESLLRHRIKRWNYFHDKIAPSLTLAIGCLGERRRRDRPHFESLKQNVVEYARDDRDPGVRAIAIEGLGRHLASDPDIEPLLIEWAATGDERERTRVIRALGDRAASDPETRSLLIERAKDDDAAVRAGATSALRECAASDLETRSLLIERAKDNDASVRAAASSALEYGVASDAQIRSVLIERAKDDDAAVRAAAISALRECAASDLETRSLLIERAKDDDAAVRAAATSALRECAASDLETRSLLIERAKDDDAAVRAAAVFALGRCPAANPKFGRCLSVGRRTTTCACARL